MISFLALKLGIREWQSIDKFNQLPILRTGDTASNAGTLALLDSYELTRNLPVAAKTATASTAAGLFRILLMPIDCFKTTMQASLSKRAQSPAASR